MRVEGGDQQLLGLQGHAVRDEPTVGCEALAAQVEQPGRRGTAADEDRVRLRQIGERVGRPALDDPQPWDAQRLRVAGDPGGALRVDLDRDRVGARVGAQPLDADRAGAGPDVPQQLAGAGREPRQCTGADVALGELAVVLEEVVGDAGRPRVEVVLGGGHLDRDHVEPGQRPGPRAEVGRPARVAELVVRAEVAQDRHPGVVEALGVQQLGHGHRGRLVGRQHQDPRSRDQLAPQRRGIAPDQRHHRRLLRGPAHPGPRERHRRHRWYDVDRVGAEQPDERRTDPGDQGVTRGQRDDPPAVVLTEEGGERRQRARPRAAFLALDRRDQAEVALAAEEDLGAGDESQRRGREVAVGADADDRHLHSAHHSTHRGVQTVPLGSTRV